MEDSGRGTRQCRWQKSKSSTQGKPEWCSKWSYSQRWEQLPKDRRSSSIRRNSARVTRLSSGSACYWFAAFVATQFPTSPRIFHVHDNIDVRRDFGKWNRVYSTPFLNKKPRPSLFLFSPFAYQGVCLNYYYSSFLLTSIVLNVTRAYETKREQLISRWLLTSFTPIISVDFLLFRPLPIRISNGKYKKTSSFSLSVLNFRTCIFTFRHRGGLTVDGTLPGYSYKLINARYATRAFQPPLELLYNVRFAWKPST